MIRYTYFSGDKYLLPFLKLLQYPPKSLWFSINFLRILWIYGKLYREKNMKTLQLKYLYD